MKKKLLILSILLPAFLVGCGSQEQSLSSALSTTSEASSAQSSSSEKSSSEQSSSSEKSSSSESSSSTASSTSEATTTSEEQGVSNYVLFGLFKGESTWNEKALTQNPSSSSEYMIQGVKLNQGDLFKVHMYGDKWYGYSHLKNSIPSGLVTQGESDDNIKVLVTGTYDIYSNYDESDNGHIYLARTDGPAPEPGTVSVTGISLDRESKFLQKGHEYTLTATVYPNNATNKEVTWRSSDDSIVKVYSSGRIEAKASGSATIYAKTTDGGKEAKCYVYVNTTGRPDYYLTGTIKGRSYSAGTYTYAAIPDPENSGKYLITDVDLLEDDEINITKENKGKLKDKSNNQTYKYTARKDISIKIRFSEKDLVLTYISIISE